MVFPSVWMLFVANSTPIVDLLSKLNSLRVNRESKLDLPTPESPISTTGGRCVTQCHPVQSHPIRFRRGFVVKGGRGGDSRSFKEEDGISKPSWKKTPRDVFFGARVGEWRQEPTRRINNKAKPKREQGRPEGCMLEALLCSTKDQGDSKRLQTYIEESDGGKNKTRTAVVKQKCEKGENITKQNRTRARRGCYRLAPVDETTEASPGIFRLRFQG